jgi:hypothetical protein
LFERLNLVQLTGLERQTGYNEVPLNLEPVVHIVTANDHYRLDDDAEWQTLFPSNHATGIHIASAGQGKKFVSVYHQLQCLNTLRQLYMNPGWADNEEKEETAHHCLNVLRQAVLCNADTTLEPGELERDPSGKVVPKASGMDLPHLCKNWVALRELVDDGLRQ